MRAKQHPDDELLTETKRNVQKKDFFYFNEIISLMITKAKIIVKIDHINRPKGRH